MKYKRIFTIVIDSLGIGAAKDSAEYGDIGVDTLGHIAEKMAVQGFHIPNLQKLGLANLCALKGVTPIENPLGNYAILSPFGKGKDTLSGHWEMMGLHVKEPFKTFTETGFPEELIDELSKRTGKKLIGNKSASGTDILEELAARELNHDELIVYTSSDSVLQICGNEDKMGLQTLYNYCEIAREITMKDEWKVGRVIARPYIGTEPGSFKRTPNRHDYAIKPEANCLSALKDGGFAVISVGKIFDIFAGVGLTSSNPSKSSVMGMDQTIDLAKTNFNGLCYTNLVDFDAVYGHRRDVIGYGKEIEKFDQKLGELLEVIQEDDLIIITADHGNDPTYKGSDHTRECVPMLSYSKSTCGGNFLGTIDTFAVLGASIADNFGVTMPIETIGYSILDLI
ncbi:MAG: phosphopentomutase [Lachnospiraceae bacterium]